MNSILKFLFFILFLNQILAQDGFSFVDDMQDRRLDVERSTTASQSATDSKYYCPVDGIWPLTYRNETVTKSCGDPRYVYGTVTRKCSDIVNPTWELVEENCFHYKCPAACTNSSCWPETNVYTYVQVPCTGLPGYLTRFCNGDETWGTIEEQCVSSYCNAVIEDNVYWPVTPSGSTRTVSCGDNYEGTLQRTCINKEWSAIVNTCQIIPLDIHIYTMESSHYLNVVPVSVFCGNRNCSIDANFVELSNNVTLVRVINPPSIVEDPTLYIDRGTSAFNITFKSGFLIDPTNNNSPISMNPNTVITYHVPIRIPPLYYEEFTEYTKNAEVEGYIEYVNDPRDTPRTAVALHEGGLIYRERKNEEETGKTILNIESGQYSFSLWFKILTVEPQYILTKPNDYGNDFAVYLDDFGTLVVSTGDDEIPCSHINTQIIAVANTWYYVGVSYYSDHFASGKFMVSVNGQYFQCLFESHYTPMLTNTIKIGGTVDLTVSHFRLFRHAVTKQQLDLWFKEYSRPSIYISTATRQSQRKTVINISFNEAIAQLDIEQFTFTPFLGSYDIQYEWDLSNEQTPKISFIFPETVGTRLYMGKLVFNSGFVLSRSTSLSNNAFEYILTFESSITNPTGIPLSVSLSPDSGTYSYSTMITATFNQEVIFQPNTLITYFDTEHSDYKKTIPIEDCITTTTSIKINIPGGIPNGRKIAFIFPNGLCTSLDNTQISNQYSLTTTTYTGSVQSFLGSLECLVKSNTIRSMIIPFKITYNKPVESFDASKIIIENGIAGIATIENNVVYFNVYPIFDNNEETTILSVSIQADQAHDSSNNNMITPAIAKKTYIIEKVIREYVITNNFADSYSTTKNCLYHNAPDMWSPNMWGSDSQGNLYNSYMWNPGLPSVYCMNTEDITFTESIKNTAMTISFWYLTTDNTQNMNFIVKYFDDQSVDYMIRMNNNKIEVITGIENDNNYIISTNAPSIRIWHLVTVTMKVISIDTVTVTIYIDGEQVITGNRSKLFRNNSLPLYIGDSYYLRIASVRFYGYIVSNNMINIQYDEYSRPRVNLEVYQEPDCGTFTLKASSNKPVKSINPKYILLHPDDAATIYIEPSDGQGNFILRITPLKNGLIDIAIKEGAIEDSYGNISLESNLITVYAKDCISRYLPTFNTLTSLPSLSPSVPFTITLYVNSPDLTQDALTAINGYITNFNYENNVISGIFTIDTDSVVGTSGYILLSTQYCASIDEEDCRWTILYNEIFNKQMATTPAPENFDTEYYQQFVFDSNIHPDWIINVDIKCTDSAIFGVKQYPYSTNNNYGYSVEIGANNNYAIKIRSDTNTIHTVLAEKTYRDGTVLCDPNEYIRWFFMRSDGVLSVGKGDYRTQSPMVSYTITKSPTFTQYIAVFGNWNTIVYYDNIWLSRLNSPSLFGSFDINMDKKPYVCELNFISDIDTPITEDSFNYTNLEFSDFQQINDHSYSFNILPIVPENTIYYSSSITLRSAVTSYTYQDRIYKNKPVSWTASLMNRVDSPIITSLTWNEQFNNHTLPIYVTLSFNRDYTAVVEDFVMDEGGSIVNFIPTHNGGIIGVVPMNSNPFSIRVLQGTITDIDYISPACSVTIYCKQPDRLVYYEYQHFYPMFSDYWRGLEPGSIGISFSTIAHSGIQIFLSPVSFVVTGAIRIVIGNHYGYSTAVQRLNSHEHWETIKEIYHGSPISNFSPHDFTLTFSNNILSVNQIDNTIEPINLMTYKHDDFLPYYYAFYSNETYINIYNIKELPIEGEKWIEIPISVNEVHGVEDLPVIVTTNNYPVTIDDFSCYNGFMTPGKINNEFYFYPYGEDGRATFYLNSRTYTRDNMYSRASAVYTIFTAPRIRHFILPPMLSNQIDIFRYFNPVWTSIRLNTLDLEFKYEPHDVNYDLHIAMIESQETRDQIRLELNICGNSELILMKNGLRSSLKTGVNVDCNTIRNFNLKVTYLTSNKRVTIRLINTYTQQVLLSYYYTSTDVDAVTINYYAFNSVSSDASGTILLNQRIPHAICVSSFYTYSEYQEMEDMDVCMCMEKCKRTSEYFGVFQGNQCICLPTYAYIAGDRIDDVNCNIPCINNNCDQCGGEQAVTIYPTTAVSEYDHLLDTLSFIKPDFPEEGIATYKAYHTTLDVLLNKNNMLSTYRNELPAYYITSLPVFVLTTRIIRYDLEGVEAAGIATYNRAGQNFITYCMIRFDEEYLVLLYRSWKDEDKTVTLPYLSKDIMEIMLRYKRDNNGIYTCSYKFVDDPAWIGEYSDINDGSVVGYKTALVVTSTTKKDAHVTFKEIHLSNSIETPRITWIHNLKNEIHNQYHMIEAHVSEYFNLDIHAHYLVKNCEVEKVIPVSASRYQIYIHVLSPGNFSFGLPASTTSSWFGNNNKVAETLYSVYDPEHMHIWIIPDTLVYLHTNTYSVYLAMSEPIFSIDLDDLDLYNSKLTDYIEIDPFTLKLSITILDYNKYATIYLPPQKVIGISGNSNLGSNTLLITPQPFCKAETINNNIFEDTPVNTYATINCPYGYKGSITRYCTAVAVWSTMVNTCILQTCPSITTDYVTYPETSYGQTVTVDRCPEGYTGYMTRKCNYINGITSWAEPISHCSSSITPGEREIEIIAHEYEIINTDLLFENDVVITIISNELPRGIILGNDNHIVTGYLRAEQVKTGYLVKFNVNNVEIPYTIYITILPTYCSLTGYPDTHIGDNLDVGCPSNSVGELVYKCLRQYPGSWSTVTNTCVVQTCASFIDTTYNLTFPETEVSQSASVSCTYPLIGTITHTCVSKNTWGPAKGQCKPLSCPVHYMFVGTIYYVFPETLAGAMAVLSCGTDGIYRQCYNNGTWSESIDNRCTICNNGEYKYHYDSEDDNKYVCVECPAGSACPNQEDKYQCQSPMYSHKGWTKCEECEGIVEENRYGPIECHPCADDEYYAEEQCIKKINKCKTMLENMTKWPTTNVGSTATMPCEGINFAGQLLRDCILDESGNAQWSDVIRNECYGVIPDPGYVNIIINFEYHHVSLNSYDLEAHYMDVRSFVQTFQFDLSKIRVWNGIEEIHNDHPFLNIFLMISTIYNQQDEVFNFIRQNLNSHVKNLRANDEIVYNWDFYIMIKGSPQIYQYYTYCHNQIYDTSVSVGDYLYWSCGRDDLIGEISAQCAFNKTVYWKEARYSGCLYKYAIQGHAYIDYFYRIMYATENCFYCGLKKNMFRTLVQNADAVLYSYDMQTFKNVTINGHKATEFRVRYEIRDEDIDRVKDTITHSQSNITQSLMSFMPSDIQDYIYTNIPIEFLNVTRYNFNSDNSKRRLRIRF
ncbi:hypothetical protein WA158_001399 [Blastocystis sp. Blastoise]